MGYNKKSWKEPKKYLKRNGAPFTPESPTRKSPRLQLSKQLSTTREDIANDSSTDSELFPSQLFAFTSPVPAVILFDDDSERSHQIIQKQGRPPKNQRKRNAATAPKYTKKRRGMSYRVINVFFDEKHRQDALFLGNTPTMCELDARKFPNKAVWKHIQTSGRCTYRTFKSKWAPYTNNTCLSKFQCRIFMTPKYRKQQLLLQTAWTFNPYDI